MGADRRGLREGPARRRSARKPPSLREGVHFARKPVRLWRRVLFCGVEAAHRGNRLSSLQALGSLPSVRLLAGRAKHAGRINGDLRNAARAQGQGLRQGDAASHFGCAPLQYSCAPIPQGHSAPGHGAQVAQRGA